LSKGRRIDFKATATTAGQVPAVFILVEKEKLRRGPVSPNRTPREKLLWDMIAGNLLSSYEHEIEWIRSAKRAVLP